MKESQIIQQRIESLEIDLAEARQAVDAAKRDEAAKGTNEERREYAQELYSKILDLECDSVDIESDAVDAFIEQVIDPEHAKRLMLYYLDLHISDLDQSSKCAIKQRLIRLSRY